MVKYHPCLQFTLLWGICTLLTKRVLGNPEFFGATNNAEYVEWYDQSGGSYGRSSFLQSVDSDALGIALHWTLDGENIRLAVAARATGWVGFGISEAGGMKGSDIILFSGSTGELVDSYVLGTNEAPYRDEIQSWQLTNSFVGNDFIIFEASRTILSSDTQDRSFFDDEEEFISPTRVVGAWGNSEAPSFHGRNFAKGAIRFFADGSGDALEDFRASMASQAEGTVELTETDYQIPSRQTTYQEKCFTAADLAAANSSFNGSAMHLIAVEPLIDPRAKSHVHHFLLFGIAKEECGDQFSEAQELIYTWAPGAVPLLLPANVGLPIGGLSGYLSFRLQIHYDNPNGLFGVLDSSGVRLYYTSQLRDFDMGIMQVGDPFVQAKPTVLSTTGGLTQHAFECGGSCTQNYFQEEVTVFGEGLHMHVNGRMASSEVVRNGVVVHTAVSEFFDFDQQGGIVIQQRPYQIQPGDGFRLTCSYDADPGERWGTGSDDEMCIAYFYYFPRQTIPFFNGETQPGCGVSIDTFLPGCGAEHFITDEIDSFERVFGRSNSTQFDISALIELILRILESLLGLLGA